MGKLQTTPGPWLSVGCTGKYEKIIGINPTVEVCRVRRHQNLLWNSLLIQAAPELLEALERMMDVHEQSLHSSDCECDLCDAWRIADKLTDRFYTETAPTAQRATE